MSDEYTEIYVFEGIDNVGKTTIIQRLKEKIDVSTGSNCVIIAFPGNDPRTLGNLVYDLHHNQKKYMDLPVNEASLQLLHVASHIDLIERKLLKQSSSHRIVLLDRFWWSTYVYGLVGGLDKEIVEAIISPELIYWKDIPVKKIFLLEREMRKRDYRMEKDSKIINIYQELASEEPSCNILNNDGSIEEIVTLIYNDILGNGNHEI